jgi:hypothetical protein
LTETLLPSATDTALPSLTPILTETTTVTPSETATVTPTATATETPSPTPTAEVQASTPSFQALQTANSHLLAYTAWNGSPTGSFDIKVLDTSTGTVQTLTSTSTLDDWYPAWAIDGTQLGYATTTRVDSSVTFNVIDYNVAGFPSHQFNPAADRLDWGPIWSPVPVSGQRRIAFMSYRTGNWEVFVVNSDGTGLVNVSNHSASDFVPAWSRDGNSLAFVSNRDGNWEIYKADLTTSTPTLTRLTNHAAIDSFPLWSPSSSFASLVLFVSNRTGTWSPFINNTSQTQPATAVALNPATHGTDWSVSWSPGYANETTPLLAFMRLVGSPVPTQFDIFVDGANATNTATEHDYHPAWRPEIYEELSQQYGFEIRKENLNGDNGEVRIEDFLAARTAVLQTAHAFNVFHQQLGGAPVSDPAIFNTVLRRAIDPVAPDPFIHFHRRPVSEGGIGQSYCQTFPGNDPVLSVNVTSIVCYYDDSAASGLSIDPYTVIHELGHIFDNSSAQGSNIPLQRYVQDTEVDVNGTPQPILDFNTVPRLVMGTFTNPFTSVSSWDRGSRGWGSGPASTYNSNGEATARQVTDYQKHAPPYPVTENPYDETGADMFLNWVYCTANSVTSACTTGFKNVSWDPWPSGDLGQPQNACLVPQGCADYRNPGDARLGWMNSKMALIFNAHGW